MRKPRLLGRSEVNYYHVMSRVVNRDFIFGNEEKEYFRLTMRKLEAFTGLKVLTYCIMSNHWHILLEVPEVSDFDDEELLDRLNRFYSKSQYANIFQDYERARTHAIATGNEEWLNDFRLKYTSRMGDLSVFVKELKERFSKWYNRKNHRRGTLWEERFKSVLVENSDHALSTMAAYIDLNPVRGGIVDDPRDYRFCGYAEAVGGGNAARRGIAALLRIYGQGDSWRRISAKYRMLLFAAGEQTDTKRGIDPQRVRKVINAKGELKLHELIHCHIRYFNDGVALGSRVFIEEVFEQNRLYFSERRKTGARKMRGGDWQGLFSMRDFSGQPVVPPI